MRRKTLLFLIILLASLAIIAVGRSGAYLSDTATSTGNGFAAGTWEEE